MKAIHPSVFGSLPVVTWVFAGERCIRVFQLACDARKWAEMLRRMDYLSEVEVMNAVVHDAFDDELMHEPEETETDTFA